MVITPDPMPRDYDVPVIYHQTSVMRSASLLHDPHALASFSSIAASYALEAYDTKESITDYLRGEFKRHYGDKVFVEAVFTFRGDHVCLDVLVGMDTPEHLSLRVQ